MTMPVRSMPTVPANPPQKGPPIYHWFHCFAYAGVKNVTSIHRIDAFQPVEWTSVNSEKIIHIVFCLHFTFTGL